jgi:hypothetical protein
MCPISSGVRVTALLYCLYFPYLGISELLLVEEILIVKLQISSCLFMHSLLLLLCLNLHS